MSSINKFNFATLLGMALFKPIKISLGASEHKTCSIDIVISVFYLIVRSIIVDEGAAGGLGDMLHDVEFVLLDDDGNTTGGKMDF